MALFRQRNSVAHTSFTCLFAIVTRHLIWTVDADNDSQYATSLEAAPNSLIALKETLDSKLLDGTAGRTNDWAHMMYADEGEHRVASSEDTIKHKFAFLQKIQDVHRVSEELDEPGEEQSAEDHSADESSPFYNDVHAEVAKLEPMRNGIKMDDVLAQSVEALTQSRDTFDSFVHYVADLEHLIAGTWQENDKLEEIHDGAINQINSELFEGNFPDDDNQPIRVMLPMGGILHFGWDCPILTPKSSDLLKNNAIPRLEKKIQTYQQKEADQKAKGVIKDQDAHHKYLICIKTKTNRPASDWNKGSPGCGAEDAVRAQADANMHGVSQAADTGAGHNTVLGMLQARQNTLVNIFKATFGEGHMENVFVGVPPEVSTGGSNNDEYSKFPGGQVVLNIFPATATISAETKCEHDNFENYPDTPVRPSTDSTLQDGFQGMGRQVDVQQTDLTTYATGGG